MPRLQAAPEPGAIQRDAIAWKTVLVHVEPGAAASARLASAVGLARQCDALLIGLGAEGVDPAIFSYEGGDGGMLGLLQEQIRADLKDAAETFQKIAGPVRTEWIALEERPAACLARMSRAADVIVAGGGSDIAHDPFHMADIAELALLSGRPVLVAPPGGGELKGRSIVVAWKDTREARRALADALPLLVAAEEVVVVEVCTDEAVDDAERHTQDVTQGLQRHGVKACARVVSAPDDQVAEMLTAEARALGADLIVSGCYGHSRLGEWLFGGVTRGLLHAPDRFLLISH